MKKERHSKQEKIAQSLRERIARGEYRPGELLPSRLELASELGVSMITLQRAFDRLADDGFVAAKGRQGTFVTSRPPHLSQYGLVFYSHPQDGTWGRFAQALVNEASAIERSGERKIPCYFEVSGHPDSEDFQKLLRDTRQHRLAGLIFTSNPSHLEGTPLLDDPGIPSVAIMGPHRELNIPRVELDAAGFFDRAVEDLSARGKRSIAVLLMSGDSAEAVVRGDLDRAMAKPGIIHKPYWRQFVDVFEAASVRNATHLLFHPEQTTRPDALIVCDDTMLEAVTVGLMAAGVRVPEDVEVIGHANFPVSPTPLPIKRLGFDARQILRTCLDTIDRQRRGESLLGKASRVPVLFEDELDRNSSPLVAVREQKTHRLCESSAGGPVSTPPACRLTRVNKANG